MITSLKQNHCLALARFQFRWESSRHTRVQWWAFPRLLFQLTFHRTTQPLVFLPELPLGLQPRSPRPGTLGCRTLTDLVNIRFLAFLARVARSQLTIPKAAPAPPSRGARQSSGVYSRKLGVYLSYPNCLDIKTDSRHRCSEGAPAGAAAPGRMRDSV